jgi:hypothetical protein
MAFSFVVALGKPCLPATQYYQLRVTENLRESWCHAYTHCLAKRDIWSLHCMWAVGRQRQRDNPIFARNVNSKQTQVVFIAFISRYQQLFLRHGFHYWDDMRLPFADSFRMSLVSFLTKERHALVVNMNDYFILFVGQIRIERNVGITFTYWLHTSNIVSVLVWWDGSNLISFFGMNFSGRSMIVCKISSILKVGIVILILLSISTNIWKVTTSLNLETPTSGVNSCSGALSLWWLFINPRNTLPHLTWCLGNSAV